MKQETSKLNTHASWSEIWECLKDTAKGKERERLLMSTQQLFPSWCHTPLLRLFKAHVAKRTCYLPALWVNRVNVNQSSNQWSVYALLFHYLQSFLSPLHFPPPLHWIKIQCINTPKLSHYNQIQFVSSQRQSGWFKKTNTESNLKKQQLMECMSCGQGRGVGRIWHPDCLKMARYF